TSYIYQTRCLSYGHWFVWLILIGASGSDTFAYLTGMLVGKHHFSELSPKKTIEGCLGGVAGAALLAVIYSFFIPEQAVAALQINIQLLFACIGALCSVVSQIGDLAASAVKRNYGIKDYSNLIPGHGGILDRFDSILFVGPFVYYLLYWFIS
ncbi:MAG: phosphatidate cytidylyltransferase, partial [Roseburia sp.]|nr:phosphatidate cytidylyltransferase [Roseburia sp.]